MFFCQALTTNAADITSWMPKQAHTGLGNVNLVCHLFEELCIFTCRDRWHFGQAISKYSVKDSGKDAEAITYCKEWHKPKSRNNQASAQLLPSERTVPFAVSTCRQVNEPKGKMHWNMPLGRGGACLSRRVPLKRALCAPRFLKQTSESP